MSEEIINNEEEKTTSPYDGLVDQIHDVDLDEIPLLVVKDGKKTLLRLGLNIEDKIENYLKDSGLLDELDSLKEKIDELSDKLKELEENGFGQKLQILVIVEDGATVIVTGPDFSETLTSSGGQALFSPENLGVYTIVTTSGGKTSTKTVTATENTTYTVTVDFQSATITVKGYGGMTINWTAPNGVSDTFTLDSSDNFTEKELTVEDLGEYRFTGIFGTDAKEGTVEVKYFNMSYEVELYIYDKIKISGLSWAEIKSYADRKIAKYVFDIGDEKDISTADGTRTVAVMDFEHDDFTYDNGEKCAIIFGTTHLGTKVYSRTSILPNSDDYCAQVTNFLNGFSSDLQAVICFTNAVLGNSSSSHTINTKVFGFWYNQVSRSNYDGFKLAYYKEGRSLIKRTSNGTGSPAQYWLAGGQDQGVPGKYYNYVDLSGTEKTTTVSTSPPTVEYADIFGFCL